MRLRSTDVNELPWSDPHNGAIKGVYVVEVDDSADQHFQVYLRDPAFPGAGYVDAQTACGLPAGAQAGRVGEICEACRVLVPTAFRKAELVLYDPGQLLDDPLRGWSPRA